MSAPVPSHGAPFATTGPQGHRGRMRARLLAHGPDGLADYEVLETLLFLSIPRRDTKPVAKDLLSRFGDLLRTLSAPPPSLAEAGLNDDTRRVWALVQEAGLFGSVQSADHSDTRNRWQGKLQEAFGSNIWSWSVKFRAYVQ